MEKKKRLVHFITKKSFPNIYFPFSIMILAILITVLEPRTIADNFQCCLSQKCIFF